MILLTGNGDLVGILKSSRSELFKGADTFTSPIIKKSDIVDEGEIYQAFQQNQYDAIIHVTSVTSMNGTRYEYRRRFEDNFQSIQHLVRIARNVNTRLVYCITTGQTPREEIVDYVEKLNKVTGNINVTFITLPDMFPAIDNHGKITDDSLGAHLIRSVLTKQPFHIDQSADELLYFTTPSSVIGFFDEVLSSETLPSETLTPPNQITVSVKTLVDTIKEFFIDSDIQFNDTRRESIAPEAVNLDVLKEYLRELSEMQQKQNELLAQ